MSTNQDGSGHDSPTPKKINSFMIGGGIIGVVLVLAYFSGPGESDTTAKPKPTQTASGQAGLGTVNPSTIFNQTFAEQLRLDLEKKQAASQKLLLDALATERQKSDERMLAALDEQGKRLREELKPPATAAAAEAAPALPKSIRAPSIKPGKLPAPETGAQDGPTQTSTPAPAPPVKTEDLAVIPPNGFIDATMINGVVAVPDQPRAFLARLQGDYVSANGYRSSLDGCMMSIEGIADLSSGRIDGKPVRMTCTFDSGLSKTWDLAGYVVGQDGIRGIPGTIVNNLTKKVIAGSITGGLAGLGETVKQRQSSTTNTSFGQTSTPTGSTGAALAGAILSGAGNNATTALAELYAQFKPTVQTGGGTRFSAVLLNQLEVPREGAYLTPTTGRKEKEQ
jgi:Bacterial conjugation TrbI-like protein